MKKQSQIAMSLKEGMVSALPLIFGFFPVAMAFGLMSKTVGVSFIESCLFSIMVFAGASQFMALDLIKAGVATGSIILATFLLNLRHLMMSASLSVRLKEIKKHWLVFVAFGVTDETFSVTSLSNKKLNVPFFITLHTAPYCSWVLGTVAGYLLGNVLPAAVRDSLGIGLYAMFMALLVPEIKKSVSVLFLSVFSGILYSVISSFGILPSSWSLVATIILAAGIGVFFIKDEVEAREVEA